MKKLGAAELPPLKREVGERGELGGVLRTRHPDV